MPGKGKYYARFAIERAVMKSDLPNHLRYVMLGLAVLCDGETGIIGAKSAGELAKHLGYERRTLIRYLNELSGQGWINKDKPTTAESLRGRKSAYALTLPSGVQPTTPSGVQVPVPSGVHTTLFNKELNRLSAPDEHCACEFDDHHEEVFFICSFHQNLPCEVCEQGKITDYALCFTREGKARQVYTCGNCRVNPDDQRWDAAIAVAQAR
jgi:hypothetical protein